VETRAPGTVLGSYTPGCAIVWSGLRHIDNCAATSRCTVVACFCSDAHLAEWRSANHRAIRGRRLSIEEADEIGAAVFGPMLVTAS